MKKLYKCSICELMLPSTDFYTRKGRPTITIQSGCKNCRAKKFKISWAENPKTSIRSKNYHYQATYGVSLTEVNEIEEDQAGLCGICFLPATRLCLDHDHNTGRIRMMLCVSCNLAVGNVKEDLFIAARLLEYLQEWK